MSIVIDAADDFELNNDYFSFTRVDGKMVFSRRVINEEDVKAMKKAIFDLVCAQNTCNLFRAPYTHRGLGYSCSKHDYLLGSKS